MHNQCKEAKQHSCFVPVDHVPSRRRIDISTRSTVVIKPRTIYGVRYIIAGVVVAALILLSVGKCCRRPGRSDRNTTSEVHTVSEGRLTQLHWQIYNDSRTIWYFDRDVERDTSVNWKSDGLISCQLGNVYGWLKGEWRFSLPAATKKAGTVFNVCVCVCWCVCVCRCVVNKLKSDTSGLWKCVYDVAPAYLSDLCVPVTTISGR